MKVLIDDKILIESVDGETGIMVFECQEDSQGIKITGMGSISENALVSIFKALGNDLGVFDLDEYGEIEFFKDLTEMESTILN